MASSDQNTATICPTCNAGKKGRNLVVALDGTMNQFHPLGKNSNVVEFYAKITKNEHQLTYYNSGIGTYANTSGRAQIRKWVANLKDLAVAWNFQDIVLAAYKWLSEHYKPEDRIFLFGFSRGAYQVRVLAAMIHVVGLIHAGNTEQISFAYELYTRSYKDSNNSQEDPKAKQFKDTFCRPEVKVHFIGVWDTVSSVGFRHRNFPKARSVDHVSYFRHALALDENRVKFSPEDIRYSLGSKNDIDSKSSMADVPQAQGRQLEEPAKDEEHIKEVWFVGCHSDVGGGNKMENQRDMMDKLPAFWILREAWKKGLDVSPKQVGFNFEAIEAPNPQKSLKGGWYLLELFPFFSRREDFPGKCLRWILPHCGAPRYIYPGQKIHASVLQNTNSKYQPLAQFSPESGHDWGAIRHDKGAKESSLIELDVYGDKIANEQVQLLVGRKDVRIDFLILRSLEKGVDACVAKKEVLDVLLDILEHHKDLEYEISDFTMKMLKHSKVNLDPSKLWDEWLDETNTIREGKQVSYLEKALKKIQATI